MIIAGVLNSNNTLLNRDSMFQRGLSHLVSSGVLKGTGNDCEVTAGQVDTGVVFMRVTRTTVTPQEQFLIPVEITTATAVNTATDGFIILRADTTKIDDPSLITQADGSGVVTIENVSVLPSVNYVLLASVTSSVITDERTYARIQNRSKDVRGFYGVDTGIADALVVTIPDLPELTDGLLIQVTVDNNNAGASTINVNGLGVQDIRKNFNQALVADELKAGMNLWLTWNEVNSFWQAISVASAGMVADQVSVTGADTTPGYLNNKLVVTGGLTKTTLNPGANEQIQLSAPEVDIQVFNTTGAHAWTKPAGAKWVEVYLWGGGGGGGSGSRGFSGQTNLGGGGGGGGARKNHIYNASELSAAEDLFVAAGGFGPSGSTGGNGNNGGVGGTSYFGTNSTYRVSAYGGGGGCGSRVSSSHGSNSPRGGGGGGEMSSGSTGTYTTTETNGGEPIFSTLYPNAITGGASSGGGRGHYGGGGGSNGSSSSQPPLAGSSIWGGAGGGGAGDAYTGSTSQSGGRVNAWVQGQGADSGNNTNSYHGQNGANGTLMFGGGGGGGATRQNSASIGGNGGNGGTRGGGGGGGCVTRWDEGTVAPGGSGGQGGRGEVIIITYI